MKNINMTIKIKVNDCDQCEAQILYLEQELISTINTKAEELGIIIKNIFINVKGE